MKKLIAGILVLGLSLSMVGCGDKKQASTEEATKTTVEDNKKNDETKVDEQNKANQDVKENTKDNVQATAAASVQKGEENKSAVETAKKQEATKPAPQQAAKSKAVTAEYVSNAPVISIDTIQISPKHVYYKDSKLVMEAYVYNGFSHGVYNINNVAIRLANNEGLIAESNFGTLDGATIGAKGYIVWTFVFDSSAIKMQNADLGYLNTQYRCGNSY